MEFGDMKTHAKIERDKDSKSIKRKKDPYLLEIYKKKLKQKSQHKKNLNHFTD